MRTRHQTYLPPRTETPRLKLGLCPDHLIKDLVKTIDQKEAFREHTYNLDAMASDLCTNRLYLSRIINLIYGMNYNQFINHCRVEFAKQLLMNETRFSLAQVAMDSGFSSTSYFTRIFKAKIGLLPREYRIMNLEKERLEEEVICN